MVDLRPVEFKEDSLKFLHVMVLRKGYHIIRGKYLYGRTYSDQEIRECITLMYARQFVANIIPMGNSSIGIQERFLGYDMLPGIPPFVVDLADPNSLQSINSELDRLWRECKRLNGIMPMDIFKYEMCRDTVRGRIIRFIVVCIFAAYLTLNACFVIVDFIGGGYG